jgi:hypothetical protein
MALGVVVAVLLCADRAQHRQREKEVQKLLYNKRFSQLAPTFLASTAKDPSKVHTRGCSTCQVVPSNNRMLSPFCTMHGLLGLRLLPLLLLLLLQLLPP